MSRVLLVSNRLPITITDSVDGLVVSQSAGGLATGLKGVHGSGDSQWIGWPGPVYDERLASEDLAAQFRNLRVVPVHLNESDIAGYYEGIANSTLWPLFHYQIDRLPLHGGDWPSYVAANQKFADAVIQQHREGDVVWVHDYHLFLVPALVRKSIPNARIAFFLHIPFPSSEVFSLLPWRTEIIEGMLGADLIGFHAASYVRHFSASVRRILGVEMEIDTVRWKGRDSTVGVFPLGVDAEEFERVANTPETQSAAHELRVRAGSERLLVSVDRLDYTKGIPSRLLAIERLLERHPEWCGKVRFLQLTAPSREQVASYGLFRAEIDELVGRINSTWSTPDWTPIHHLHRSVEDLAALYCAADVMLVTPLRDGMNLVAKEFIASRVDGDGVLVLSEFAGAATELADALYVNPYDLDSFADTIHRALLLAPGDRQRRMHELRVHVTENTAQRWSEDFLRALDRVTRTPPAAAPVVRLQPPLPALPHPTLLLDYDGSLVPFAPTPNEAVPDAELLELLAHLAAGGANVNIISGRPRAFLEEHFGHLPIGLHAEHGLWSRPAASRWARRPLNLGDWRSHIRGYLEHFCRATPGSLLEEKDESFSWHFRRSHAEFTDGNDFGEFQAKELRLLLTEVLGNARVQVLVGNRVIEVKPSMINKGLVVPFVLNRPHGEVIAVGDDVTDEDLFGALPPSAISIKVGNTESCAQFRLDSYRAVREYLHQVVEALRTAAPLPPGPKSNAHARANKRIPLRILPRDDPSRDLTDVR